MYHGIGHMVTGGRWSAREAGGVDITSPQSGPPPPPQPGPPPLPPDRTTTTPGQDHPPPRKERSLTYHHLPPQEGKVIDLPPTPNIQALCAGRRYASYWDAFLLKHRSISFHAESALMLHIMLFLIEAWQLITISIFVSGLVGVFNYICPV